MTDSELVDATIDYLDALDLDVHSPVCCANRVECLTDAILERCIPVQIRTLRVRASITDGVRRWLRTRDRVET